MSEPQRILVVEDDLSILSGLTLNLRFEGYEVIQTQDGAAGLRAALEQAPHLVVLDVMLPVMNGYALIRELRRRGNDVPVLMLSAKGQEPDKVLGLTLGADDYVVKPFGLQELMARIKALLRRRYSDGKPLQFSEVAVDLAARTVKRAGEPVELTAQEFRLLARMIASPGKTFEREELLAAAWGLEYEGTARTVDNFVRQLRLKLEPDPETPRHFLTVRGLGYRFEP